MKIKPEYEEYYKYLEVLRKSGITNMFGATPYLQKQFKIDRNTAVDVLSNWMENYNELSNKYNWR